MSRSSLVKNSIFDEFSQYLTGVTSEQIRPVGDRVLIADVPDEEECRGLLWVPDVARDRELLRMGRVVAVGTGDKFFEQFDERLQAPRRWSVPCQSCSGRGTTCPNCDGSGNARIPMECQPGDLVIYDRRKEAEFYVDGLRLSLVHEEQSVVSKLDGDTLVPCHDWLLLKQDAEVSVSGGLHLPARLVTRPRTGVVLAVGPGKWGRQGRVPPEFEVGDRIHFKAGSQLRLFGRELMVMRGHNVLVVETNG